ncbi:hypothetical protein CNMCM8927_000850 [Aspergillus lentulus]|uniref:Uncharacterized protein n=1 Tax=Aspergillus lentulus TaxID=293939 RepID=A0AAN6BLT4_ASPLE|nr:hypothetical protein CNMCM8927_000850 [Aspergillus lentulus]
MAQPADSGNGVLSMTSPMTPHGQHRGHTLNSLVLTRSVTSGGVSSRGSKMSSALLLRLFHRAYGKCWPWGYFIYRTVYTPESDQIDRVHGDWYTEAEDQDHGFPEKLVHESYKNVILEDKERWDAASIEQIREDFKALIASRGAEIGTLVRGMQSVWLLINTVWIQ